VSKPPEFKPLMWPDDFNDDRDWEELTPFERELVELMATARPTTIPAMLDELERELGKHPPGEPGASATGFPPDAPPESGG
jgi:hypothetical protein